MSKAPAIATPKNEVPKFDVRNKEDIKALEQHINREKRFGSADFKYDTESNKNNVKKMKIIVAPLAILDGQLAAYTMHEIKKDIFKEAPPIGVYAGVRYERKEVNGEIIYETRDGQQVDDNSRYLFEVYEGDEVIAIVDADQVGDVMRFLNHSKAGNVVVDAATKNNVRNNYFYPVKTIPAGHQLLFDYDVCDSTYFYKNQICV